MTTLLAIGLFGAFLLFLIALALILRGLELAFPSLRRFLDEHVGEEPEWRKW